MNKKCEYALSVGLTFALALIVGAVSTSPIRAQENVDCANAISRADSSYSYGSFDEAIELLNSCMNQGAFDESEQQRAYVILGRAYLAQNLEEQARSTLRELIRMVPHYEPSPEYPPSFRKLVQKVKRDMGITSGSDTTATASSKRDLALSQAGQSSRGGGVAPTLSQFTVGWVDADFQYRTHRGYNYAIKSPALALAASRSDEYRLHFSYASSRPATNSDLSPVKMWRAGVEGMGRSYLFRNFVSAPIDLVVPTNIGVSFTNVSSSRTDSVGNEVSSVHLLEAAPEIGFAAYARIPTQTSLLKDHLVLSGAILRAGGLYVNLGDQENESAGLTRTNTLRFAITLEQFSESSIGLTAGYERRGTNWLRSMPEKISEGLQYMIGAFESHYATRQNRVFVGINW